MKHVGQQGHFQVRPAGATEPIDFCFAPEHANPILVYLKNRLCQGEDQEWEESWEEVKLKPEPVPEKKLVFKIGDNVCFFSKHDNRWYQGQVLFSGSFDGKIFPCLASPPSIAECLGKTVLVKQNDGGIQELDFRVYYAISMSPIIAILP